MDDGSDAVHCIAIARTAEEIKPAGNGVIAESARRIAQGIDGGEYRDGKAAIDIDWPKLRCLKARLVQCRMQRIIERLGLGEVLAFTIRGLFGFAGTGEPDHLVVRHTQFTRLARACQNDCAAQIDCILRNPPAPVYIGQRIVAFIVPDQIADGKMFRELRMLTC